MRAHTMLDPKDDAAASFRGSFYCNAAVCTDSRNDGQGHDHREQRLGDGFRICNQKSFKDTDSELEPQAGVGFWAYRA